MLIDLGGARMIVPVVCPSIGIVRPSRIVPPARFDAAAGLDLIC